ncbi:deoxyribose-phosphate aldolase [bacterium]|nr:deoxyribose-phosphate aldolase [bacterium]
MKINEYIEHTLLAPNATNEKIENLIKEAQNNKFFGICINPSYIKFAKNIIEQGEFKPTLVTVVNFPLASNTLPVILAQTELALADGAQEIDTVVNISELKNKNYAQVELEIKKTKEVCGKNNLKVILETDLLEKDEIKIASEISANAGANFVKTSTGFVKGGAGATVEAVKIMYETVKSYNMGVKASGGIKTYTQAIALIEAGATRLGTSSGIEIMKG